MLGMLFSAPLPLLAGDNPLEILRLSRESFTLPCPRSLRYELAFSHSSFFLADLLAEDSTLAGDVEENGFTDLLGPEAGPETPCVCAGAFVFWCHDPIDCATLAGGSYCGRDEGPAGLPGLFVYKLAGSTVSSKPEISWLKSTSCCSACPLNCPRLSCFLLCMGFSCT